MLSKEEIEYIEELEKAIENDESFYWQEDMYKLIEIIRKQHGREQKLIEKLEKDKETLKKENADGTLQDYIIRLLEIVKGENQVTIK